MARFEYTYQTVEVTGEEASIWDGAVTYGVPSWAEVEKIVGKTKLPLVIVYQFERKVRDDGREDYIEPTDFYAEYENGKWDIVGEVK